MALGTRISSTSLSGWMLMLKNSSASGLAEPRARMTVPPWAPAARAASITFCENPAFTMQTISSCLWSSIYASSLTVRLSFAKNPYTSVPMTLVIGTVKAMPL